MFLLCSTRDFLSEKALQKKILNDNTYCAVYNISAALCPIFETVSVTLVPISLAFSAIWVESTVSLNLEARVSAGNISLTSIFYTYKELLIEGLFVLLPF